MPLRIGRPSVALTLVASLLQCYRDDEVLAFHMQNDTTEEYIQWLRRYALHGRRLHGS